MRSRFSLQEQIACVKREIAFRERVYPRWVVDRKMSQNRADTELGCMRAVLESLQRMTAMTRDEVCAD